MYPWGQSNILLDDDCLKLQLNTDLIIAKIFGAGFSPYPMKSLFDASDKNQGSSNTGFMLSLMLHFLVKTVQYRQFHQTFGGSFSFNCTYADCFI